MASYDSSEAVQAWIVEDGNYTITLGKNAHDAWETFDLVVSGVEKSDIAANENIRNLFAQAELGLNLMTRADFQGTYPEIMEQGTTAVIPEGLLETKEFTAPVNFDKSMVKAGQNYAEPIMLTDLVGKDVDDPLWQKYIAQFTAEEMIPVITDMGYKVNAVERLGLPAMVAKDGPAQIKEMFGTTATLAYPG